MFKLNNGWDTFQIDKWNPQIKAGNSQTYLTFDHVEQQIINMCKVLSQNAFYYQSFNSVDIILNAMPLFFVWIDDGRASGNVHSYIYGVWGCTCQQNTTSYNLWRLHTQLGMSLVAIWILLLLLPWLLIGNFHVNMWDSDTENFYRLIHDISYCTKNMSYFDTNVKFL